MLQPRSGWHLPTRIAVVGAVGGCGTSTTAVALATALSVTGATWLLDLAPASGLELLLGAEAQHGLRWHELNRTRGDINIQQLAAECPDYCDVPVILGGREETEPPNETAARSILASMTEQQYGAVADVDISTLMRLSDLWTHVVIVAPLTLQGLASTHQLTRYLAETGVTSIVVASMLTPPDLTTAQFENSLGKSVAAYLPAVNAIRPAILHGLGPLGAGARATRKLLDYARNLADRIGSHANL